MARSMWTGSVSFGLVNIPVKLFNAVSPKTVRFHLLHAKDGVRIRQKRVCPADGEEVSNDDLIKGYEISKNRYVPIQPEELEALDPKATHTVDILDFVPADQIDPLYFDHPYYLAPDRGAQKAYALLRAAMEDANKVAIAQVVLRTKQYTVALRPLGKALLMSTLFFQDEVIREESLDDLPAEDYAVNARELQMARQLVDSLTTQFRPEQYHDTYREQVLELIERKAQGQEVVTQPAEVEQPRVLDLMAALEASLAKAKGRGIGGAAHEKDEAEAAAGERGKRRAGQGKRAGG
jgi:DNA end-binding protein Ku